MNAPAGNTSARPYLGDSCPAMQVNPKANPEALFEAAVSRLYAVLDLCRPLDGASVDLRAHEVAPLVELATREALGLVRALHETSEPTKGGEA